MLKTECQWLMIKVKFIKKKKFKINVIVLVFLKTNKKLGKNYWKIFKK